MGNLFLCSGGGQSGGSGETGRAIQRHVLNEGNVSGGLKTFYVKELLPEGVDYTKLTLDNFAITRIGINETTTHANLSAVTPDIPYIYAKIYHAGKSLVNLTKYDNTTGQLTVVTVGASLSLGESPNGDELNALKTQSISINIKLELFI